MKIFKNLTTPTQVLFIQYWTGIIATIDHVFVQSENSYINADIAVNV